MLSLKEIIHWCVKEKKDMFCYVITKDMRERDVTYEESFEKMRGIWRAITHADRHYKEERRSASGFVGGEGARLEQYFTEHEENALCSGLVHKSMVVALKMAESNACMRRIVAAPTAGSCGVLPAVLIPFYERKQSRLSPDASEEEKQELEDAIVKALYVASGIGEVIADRASISGAQGGCQAEIGSASAMAAGAMVYLQGGDTEQICHGAAMALKGLLGLTCDPVGGLVEIPCVKRNVIGTVNALSCADMAMAGIKSKIPPDEVIDAMAEIGEKMDSSLKETALGGLAVTPKAMELTGQMPE